MAALHSCTVQWQDPRDMLQTSSWRCSTGQPPQHLLFAAVAAELQPMCQLVSGAQKVSSKTVAFRSLHHLFAIGNVIAKCTSSAG